MKTLGATKLLAWMQDNSVTDDALALRIGGDCTVSAVKKWKYGERVPTPERIALLEDITARSVTLRDWVQPAESAAA
jgi:hypothetical protein